MNDFDLHGFPLVPGLHPKFYKETELPTSFSQADGLLTNLHIEIEDIELQIKQRKIELEHYPELESEFLDWKHKAYGAIRHKRQKIRLISAWKVAHRERRNSELEANLDSDAVIKKLRFLESELAILRQKLEKEGQTRHSVLKYFESQITKERRFILYTLWLILRYLIKPSKTLKSQLTEIVEQLDWIKDNPDYQGKFRD